MNLFRSWVHQLWIENCEERLLYRNGDRLSEKDYFQQFKWWLKREYRHHRHKELEREKINERFREWHR